MPPINDKSQSSHSPTDSHTSVSEHEKFNQAGHSSNGHALAVHEGRESGDGLDLKDASSRILLEKILVALSQDSVAGGNDKSTAHFNLFDYAAVIRRRWLPMLLVFVATITALTWRLKPGVPEYSATSTMLLPSAVARNDDSSDPLKTAISSDIIGSNIATKIALVTSPPLVKDGLARLDTKTRIAGWGDPNVEAVEVSAAAPVSSDLINITVRAADPEAATKLANILIEVYGEHTKKMVRGSYEDSLELIADQKKGAEKLLFQAKRELQDFKEKSGILSIDTQLIATAQQVADLEKSVRAAQLEASAGVGSSAVRSDSLVTELKQKITIARQKYEILLGDLFPDAPEVRQARQELQDTQQALDKRLGEIQSASQKQATLLQAQLNEARLVAAKLPSTEFKLSQLISKVKLIEATYDTLSNRYTAMSLARYNKVDSPTVMTPAVAARPVGRTWTNTILVATLCALVMAGLMATLLEQLDNSVHSTGQLEEIINAPIIGTLPLIDSVEGLVLSFSESAPDTTIDGATVSQTVARGEMSIDKVDNNTAMAVSRRSSSLSNLLLESCRFMRTNLMFSAVDTPLRSVLITSADSGEGKSFCARNLASVMAYDGKKVILVDCDLRRPVQHRLIGKPLTPGFTNVVLEPHLLDEALHETQIANLRILTAGAIPPNPPELLGSEHSHYLIAELQKRCDFLIIDSPPALSLTDAQVLSSMVDGVLIVVGADSTSVQHIQHAQSNVRQAGGRLLGAIFNKIRPHNDPYGYHGYYKYGSYRYYSYESKEETVVNRQ